MRLLPDLQIVKIAHRTPATKPRSREAPKLISLLLNPLLPKPKRSASENGLLRNTNDSLHTMYRKLEWPTIIFDFQLRGSVASRLRSSCAAKSCARNSSPAAASP